MESVTLRRSRGGHVLATEFVVHQIFLAHHFLRPVEDRVNARGWDTRKLGNAFGDQQSAGQILGKVAVLEIGQKLFLSVNFRFNRRVGETAVALVGDEHAVEVGLIANVVAVRVDHPVADVHQGRHVHVGIFFFQDALDFEHLVGAAVQHLARELGRSLVKEWRLVQGFGDVLVVVVAVGNGRVPDRVDVHERDSQEIAAGLENGETSHQFLQQVLDRFDGGFAHFGSNDNINFLFGSQHLDNFTVVENAAGPRQGFERKEIADRAEIVTEAVAGLKVKASLSWHGTENHAGFQILLQGFQIIQVKERGQSHDDDINVTSFNGFRWVVGNEDGLAKDVRAEVVLALHALFANGVAQSIGFTGVERENDDIAVGLRANVAGQTVLLVGG